MANPTPVFIRRINPGEDHPFLAGVFAEASLDNETVSGYVFQPDTPIPGEGHPDSRIAGADVRVWADWGQDSGLVAEARIDSDRPDVGYVVEAWSRDEEAHARLMAAIKTCLAAHGLGERYELRWLQRLHRTEE